MTTMNIVEPRLAAFVERMREKLALPKNTAKSDWRLMRCSELLDRIECEIEELKSALEDNANHYDEGTVHQVVSECADVANFCMMLADRVRS